MPTIAQLKQQVDRIWVASFQTDLADTLAAHLRSYALAGVKAALETALPGALDERSWAFWRRHYGMPPAPLPRREFR